MHVALVHRDLHQRTRGGICTLYRALVTELVSRGLRATLLTQQTPHPVRVDGAAVVTMPRTDDLAAHRNRVARALDKLEPDIVECSTWHAEVLAYLHRDRVHRAPVLVRGEFSAVTLGAINHVAPERDLVRRADAVIAVSAFAARDLAAAYGIPVPRVVPNGVDRGRFQPGTALLPRSGYRVTLAPDGQPLRREALVDLFASGRKVPPWAADPRGRVRLLWIGKITPMKGWDILETAVRRLRRIATVTAVLGHARARLPITVDTRHDLTVLHDLDDADMPCLYRAADWLLCTSRWEGFGLAVAEALACGTPVLVPERLGTGSALLAAGGGHSYRDLDNLNQLLTQGIRPDGMLPRRFNWHANAETTISIYQELLRTA